VTARTRAAREAAIQGSLLGFDVSGFTQEVKRLGALGGAHGFETATDRLGSAFGAVVRASRSEGYAFGDVLGDCLILVHRKEFDQGILDAAAMSYAAVFSQASGFPVKAAGCSGRFRTITLPFDLPGGRTILLGPAVADLHARLEAAQPAGPTGQPANGARRDASLLDRKLGSAVAMRSIVAFCRLGGSRAPYPGDANLIGAAAMLRDFATQHGGALHKITHDSKGIVASMTLPADIGDTIDLAAAFKGVHTRLGEGAVDAAISLSAGSIYLGPIDIDGDRRTMVHGVAVNSAAKRLSRAGSGVFFDRAAAARLRRGPQPVIEAPLLGRDGELSALALLGDQAMAGAVRRAHVEGVAGIGKSRLLRALTERLVDRFVCAAVQCQVEDASRPFHAAASLVSALVPSVWTGGDPADSLLAASREAGLTPEHMPLAADMLGVRMPGAAQPEPGAWQADAKRDILRNLLNAAVERVPVALFVDDGQWCDFGTSGLLAENFESGRGLLIVSAARPSGMADRPQRAHALRLEPLTDRDAAKLCRSFLPTGRSSVEAEILRVGHGNPLMLTQVAAAVRAGQGALALEDARLRRRPQAFATVLERRLSSLPPSQLAALRFLAAAGIGLRRSDLAGLFARSEMLLADDPLDALIEQGLAVPLDGAGGRRFRVSHQIVGAAVLKATPRGAVVRLHEHIARHAQRGTLGRSLPPAQHAAYWMHAKRPERAALKFGLAADKVLSVGGYREAIDLFERAESQLAEARVEPACRARRRMEWSVKKAQAHWGRGEMAPASACLDQAFALYGELTGGPGTWPERLRSRLGLIAGVGDAQFRRAGTRARRAFLLAHSIRSELAQFMGEVGPLVRSSLTSSFLARGTSDGYAAEARAYAMFSYVLGLARMGPLRSALLAYAGRRVARAPRSHPRAFLAASEAVYRMLYGEWDAARIHLMQAHALNRGPTEPHLAELVLTLEALTDHFGGDPVSAAERFRQLGVRARARGNRLHSAWGDYGRAQALLATGDDAGAAPLLDAAARSLDGSGDIQSRLIVAGLQAGLARRRGDIESAVPLALAAFALAKTVPPTNLSSLEGYAQPAQVLVAALGVRDLPPALAEAARADAEPAVKLLEKFGMILPIGRPRAALVRALLLRAKGRDGEAATKAGAARRLAQRYAMALDAALVEREFPEAPDANPARGWT
jgi:tetratricopeptide (TPR) repeat protein